MTLTECDALFDNDEWKTIEHAIPEKYCDTCEKYISNEFNCGEFCCQSEK